MNILYLSYDGITDPLGQSQILPYLNKISLKGVQYTLITFEKKKCHKNFIDNSNIQWVKLRYHKNPAVLSTLYDVSMGIFLGFYFLCARKVCLIHARGYVAALIALTLKKITGTKFIFDMRGFWVDERAEAGLWRKDGYLYKIAKFFEKIFFMQADAIVSLTAAAKRNIESFAYLKNRQLFIEVIPTCVDIDKFSFVTSKVSAKNENRFLFIYVGSISTWYMPEGLLDFFSVAKDKIANAHLMILTKEKQIAEDILKKRYPLWNEKLYSIRSAEYSDIPAYLMRARAGLAFYKPGYSRLACSPTKLGEYLACGLPVIINNGIGDSDEIIERERVGAVIGEFNNREYEAAISKIEILLSEKETLKKRCMLAALKYFSLYSGAEKYRNVYEQLL